MRPPAHRRQGGAVRVLPPGHPDYHAGQGKQGNGVGDDHQVVEHIGQLPHQVVGHRGAQENKDEGDHGYK